jgi:hypothetical protein
MVEPFAGSSGMAIANQFIPPQGAYTEGADQGRAAGFYVIVLSGQEKKQFVNSSILF